jgi:AraC-like DNA-binding protein
MFSNLERGSSISRPANGLTVRYVGRGEECYRIDGRAYRLAEGQLMIAPQSRGAEIDIRASGVAGTLGLCAFLSDGPDQSLAELDAPIILSADVSPAGHLMQGHLRAMTRPTSSRRDQATHLVRALRREVPKLIDDFVIQADRIEAARAETKFEAVRKVHIARSYLHAVTDRVVGLAELASATGMSRFHLQRSFQQALGQSPAAYHRRLRMELALGEVARRGVNLEVVSYEFGFAGASSLSHTYKRIFGRSPVWSKADRTSEHRD